MRQHHIAGEKAFVDYSGKRIAIVDPETGEILESAEFSATFCELVTCAHSRRATVR